MRTDTFSIACPSCHTQLKATSQHIGKKARCKRCGSTFLLSRPKEEARVQLAPSEMQELAAAILSDQSIAISYRAVQEKAAEKLIGCGEAASPIVCKVLLNTRFKTADDYHNAAILCKVLGKIGGEEARKTLELLKNADPPVAEFSIVKQAAIKALSAEEPAPQEPKAPSPPSEQPGDIFEAVKGDHNVDVVKAFIESNPGCVNARDSQDWTPLFWVAGSAKTDVLELLLAKGASPNAREKFDGETPLFWAASRGRAKAAELLLAHGADVNARTNIGKTALIEARQQGHRDVVEVLVTHGAEE